MDEDPDVPDDPDDLDPTRAKFLPILFYVLGFMVALAVLAAAAAWLLRHLG